MDPISGAGPIKQTAMLLLYGWGYNFYRAENQLRADDLLIRTKVVGILSAARGYLKALENDWRREYLPAPTREQPFPDRAKVDQARRMERCGTLIEAVSTKILDAATPTNDKVWLRHRSEKGLLEILEGIDVRLIDGAVAFHDLVIEWQRDQLSDPAIESVIDRGLQPLRSIIAERAERLTLLV